MEIADTNILYDAMRASMKGSAWKREPQKYYHDWLLELREVKQELNEQSYHTSASTEFTINERGKIRHIYGNRMRDRTVRHALCDNVLGPCLDRYLITNNCASQKGKGISAQRKNFERDLHNFFLAHGNNDGVIGFVDLSKFYDNIRHDEVKCDVYPKIPYDTHWLMNEILSSMEVDVSYMTEEEFARCMEEKFDSARYYTEIPAEAKTGEKMMRKSVNIGDQVSQNIGVFIPTRIDNYCKIVRGLRFYGRYMDDIYFITETREEAKDIIDGIRRIAAEHGLFINEKKTQIVKLSGNYIFLQNKYTLSDTGKVIVRVNPKTVTRERRKLKAYRRLLDRGVMPYPDIENAFCSWMGNYAKKLSKRQRKNIIQLYKNLFDGRIPQWKKQGTKSHSRTAASSSPCV